LEEKLLNHDTPSWIKVDPKKVEAVIVAIPAEFDIPFDISKVVDYYSKTAK